MIELLQAASTLQFVLACAILVSLVMLVLQVIIYRGVWTGYLVLFFGSLIGLAVTLR